MDRMGEEVPAWTGCPGGVRNPCMDRLRQLWGCELLRELQHCHWCCSPSLAHPNSLYSVVSLLLGSAHIPLCCFFGDLVPGSWQAEPVLLAKPEMALELLVQRQLLGLPCSALCSDPLINPSQCWALILAAGDTSCLEMSPGTAILLL